MIASPHNEKLKTVRRLRERRGRDRLGLFVAEGEDLLAAAAAAGWPAVFNLCADGSGLPGEPVSSELLAAASELGSGTRCLAVYEERWAPAVIGPLAVYLHGVRDPGNAGTVVRAAEAFGASCVAFGPDSADPYAPKAVRASMGSIFNVPLTRADVAELPGRTIALDASGPDELCTVMDAYRPRRDTECVTLLVGAERHGLPAEILAAADTVARIPTQIHSLNAAMAATIALYELTRPRDRAGDRRMPRG